MARAPLSSSLGWTLLAYGLAGLVPSLTQQALVQVDAYTLVAGRQLLVLGLLLALGRGCGFGIAEPQRLGAGEWLRLCVAAWFGIALPALWLAHGIARSGAAHAAALAPLTPLLALAIAQAPTLATSQALGRGVALALGAAAALLVLGASGGSARGDLWIILGSACGAIQILAAAPLAARHTPQRVTLWAVALSLPPLLLLAAAVAPTRPLPGLAGLAWLVLLAAVCSAACVAAWLATPRSLDPGPRAAWAGTEALVGLAAAAMALGERTSGSAALAASVLAAGSAWSARPGARGSPLAGLAALGAGAPAGPAHSLAPGLPEILAPDPPPHEAPRAQGPRAAPQGEFARLHELVAAARERLPEPLWHALIGGAETEHGVARNRRALDELALRPRVLCDVSQLDASVPALQTRLRIPVVLAPLAGLESLAPGGALACAQAARAFGTGFVQSSLARPELEVTARAGAAPHIFQIDVQGDAGWLDAQVERALASGCAAVCLSTECAARGRLEREPPRPGRGAEGVHAAALSWKYVEHYKQRFRLPLVLKGIATGQDAQRACQLGVEVLYVSNHGGRQLDHCRAAAAVLPEVADAAAERAQLWVNGGFCRGTDVVKALALGAHAVAIGRLQAYGLAAAGERGVLRVLELLEEEILTALALLGVSRPEQLDRSYVERCEALAQAHVLSAFPLLGGDPRAPR